MLGADPDRPAFVQFGYWDSLKKGLLAGDRLTADLRRMEAFYLDTNRRRLELTRSFSLAAIDPMALVQLRTTGSCSVTLDEWLYDLDHPGHYQRRLRAVAMSVPRVTGPYTNVNATLTLTGNGVRLIDDPGGDYGDPLVTDDARRFAAENVPVTMIATSHGRADHGVFDVRSDDDRYLPFEGAGAVSKWAIALKKEHNQFDLATVTDVDTPSIEYTALPGGAALTTAANTALNAKLPKNGARLLARRRIRQCVVDSSTLKRARNRSSPLTWAFNRFRSQFVARPGRLDWSSHGPIWWWRVAIQTRSTCAPPRQERTLAPASPSPLTVPSATCSTRWSLPRRAPLCWALGDCRSNVRQTTTFAPFRPALISHAYLVLQFGTP